MNVIVKNKKLSGEISGISSKSYAQRALFAALLSYGESNIVINEISKDIEAALGLIKDLGCKVTKKDKSIKIIPPEKFNTNINLNVKESGTSLRFLIPIVAVLGLNVRIKREGTLRKRTNAVYFNLLPKYGVEIKEDGADILVKGKLESGDFIMPGNISSQFISGFLIALGYLKEESRIILNTELESKAYVDMTVDILRKFGADISENGKIYRIKGGYKSLEYEVEKDWSNALFFLAGGVEVKGLDRNSKQADKNAIEIFEKLGYRNVSDKGYKFEKIAEANRKIKIDAKNIPDAVPIMCIFSAKEKVYVEVVNIERLRLKESDRVKSTIAVLNALGVEVDEKENSFSFHGVEKFKACEMDAFNDHRIAMSLAIASVFADGEIKIKGAECVEKSYSEFFKDLEKVGGICQIQ